jgi:sugar phosphate isomerase/epimerase
VQFSIESLPFREVSLQVMGQAVARLGFRAVNVWASAPPLAAHVDVTKDDPWLVGRRLDRLGLRAVGVTMYGKSLEEMSAGVTFASALGAERVVFDCEANYGDFVGRFLPPLLQVAEREDVDLCVENHLTVPFTPDFEHDGHEQERWEEGVDSYAQIKRLVTRSITPSSRSA